MSAFQEELVGVIQGIAISYSSWRGSDSALADFITRGMQKEFSEAEFDNVRRLLHSTPLQAALAARDVALFRGADGLFRLIDQQPISLKGAILRTAHHPGPDCCRSCLLNDPRELEIEKAPDNSPIQGSFLHKHCANAWRKLKMQVADHVPSDSG